jgi:hypothetical protein
MVFYVVAVTVFVLAIALIVFAIGIRRADRHSDLELAESLSQAERAELTNFLNMGGTWPQFRGIIEWKRDRQFIEQGRRRVRLGE